MRLIDADKLLELIKEQKEREIGGYTKGINAGLNIAKSIINDKTQTPTAYDVDKVVEQLESESARWQDSGDAYNDEKEKGVAIGFRKAIKIVKGGGVDAKTDS